MNNETSIDCALAGQPDFVRLCIQIHDNTCANGLYGQRGACRHTNDVWHNCDQYICTDDRKLSYTTPKGILANSIDFINVYFDFQHTLCVSTAFGSCAARSTFP